MEKDDSFVWAQIAGGKMGMVSGVWKLAGGGGRMREVPQKRETVGGDGGA